MLTFKVLSALLVYPEREVIDSLEEMAAIVDREALLPAAARADLRAFMETLKATDLMETQSNYISLFDQSRSLSLHLFEHIHGESRDRGQAMVDLLQHYRANGLDLTTVDLPDYLPLFLEFLSLQQIGEIQDRTSVVSGQRVSVRVDIGGRRFITKHTVHKNQINSNKYN